VDNKGLHKSKKKVRKKNKESKHSCAVCLTHTSALFGCYTICKDIFAFTKVDVMRAGNVKTTRYKLLAPYLHRISTPLPNIFLVLIEQSKCRNKFRKHAGSTRVAHLARKIELSLDKHTLQENSCIEMPRSGKCLPRWRSKEGRLNLVESLGATAGTKVLAQGTSDRRAEVVDERLRTQAFRERLHLD
jgi:hypothetical protein